MSQKFDHDVVVIGGGSGGYAAARTCAAQGLNTAVVEGGEEVGGLCILRGCMPTKALLYAAEIMHHAKTARTWGIHAPEVSYDFAEVMARKDKLIREFAEYRQQQLADGRFKLIRSQARFTDPHTLALSSGERVTSRHFVIATGSVIAPSPLPHLNFINCLNSDSTLRLRALPKSIIVLGGGAVALEYAQFFRRFGVQVTLVQRSAHVLHEFDSDAATEVENALRDEGMTVYTGTRLVDARCGAQEKEIVFEHNDQTVSITAEQVFYGLGRIPNIAALGLETIGVQVQYGRIVTDTKMQTTVPHIFAAGDCTGLHEIVHIAIQQGETAGFNIADSANPRHMDYRLLTEVVFTDPQIATVGLNEKRAHVKGVLYLTAKYPFNDHGKSLIMEARRGFVKLLADPQNGEIIGGCCVGPHAGELIHEIIAAMHKHMTVRELASMPHYHPTLAEIWTYPAEELADQIDRVRTSQQSA